MKTTEAKKHALFEKSILKIIKTKIFIRSIGLVILLWIILGFLVPIFFMWRKYDDPGQFGDMFGGVNALFTGLAAAFSFTSTILLMRQNKLQQIQIDRQKENDDSRDLFEKNKIIIELAMEFLKSNGPEKLSSAISLIFFSNRDDLQKTFKEKFENHKDEISNQCSLLKYTIIESLLSDHQIYLFPMYLEINSLIHFDKAFDKLLVFDREAADAIRSDLKQKSNDFRFIMGFLTIYLKVFTDKADKLPDLLSDHLKVFYFYMEPVLYVLRNEKDKHQKLELLLKYGKIKGLLK